MRFFRPKPAFFTWIKQTVLRNPKMAVVDCGCGDGDLVLELNKKKLPAIGVDLRYEFTDQCVPLELASRLMSMPAERCTFVTSYPSILLVCRPCHDGFPGRINRVRHPKSLLFYIGHEHNLEFDVSGATTNIELDHVVGREGERIWSIKHGTGDDDIDFRLALLSGDRRLLSRPSLQP